MVSHMCVRVRVRVMSLQANDYPYNIPTKNGGRLRGKLTWYVVPLSVQSVVVLLFGVAALVMLLPLPLFANESSQLAARGWVPAAAAAGASTAGWTVVESL